MGDYEYKTYGVAFITLDGTYTLAELKDIVAHWEVMGSTNQKHLDFTMQETLGADENLLGPLK